MRPPSHGHLRHQVDTLRRQSLQEGGLLLADVLTVACIEEALREIKSTWYDRIYNPLVTLWVFLGQVLNADQSCRAAVARLIADRASCGLEPCSSETGAYCQARRRLPEAFFSDVARRTGRALETEVDAGWLWKSRRVYIYDGSSVSMPGRVLCNLNSREADPFAHRPDVIAEPGGHRGRPPPPPTVVIPLP